MISKRNKFITNANLKHQNKYNYDKANYIKSCSKVTIVCPIHGEFQQTPNHHLSGGGCSECAGNKKMTTDTFKHKSNIIHNMQYDYSHVHYINNYTDVDIICKQHGMFKQRPIHHLNGSGCGECAIDKTKLSIVEFIDKAKSIHGNRYSYTDSQYIDTRTKISIICSEHGTFEQTPNSHLSGSGCPSCSETGFKDTKQGIFYVFLITDSYGNPLSIKYGITNNDVSMRKWQHEHHTSGYKFEILMQKYYDNGYEARMLESRIKLMFPVPHLTKNELRVGYTETIQYEYYDKLMVEIKKGA